MVRPFKLVVLAAAFGLAVPGGASAAATQIAPDFDEAYAYASCGTLVAMPQLPGACEKSATAAVDGTVAMTLRASTPLAGRVPGPAGATGDLQLGLRHPVGGITARLLVYTVTLHIDDAHVTQSSRPLSRSGYGGIELYASADLEENGTYDWDSESGTIVGDGGSPSRVTDADITLTFVLGNGVSHTYAGMVSLSTSIYGYAYAGTPYSADVPRGSVETVLDGRVTSVTFEAVV